MGLTKRIRIQAAQDARNANLKENVDASGADPEARLIMHDDNTTMIHVFKPGKNPTMRTLGRTHGISINSMHEYFCREDMVLGAIPTSDMVADIHTEAYP